MMQRVQLRREKFFVTAALLVALGSWGRFGMARQSAPQRYAGGEAGYIRVELPGSKPAFPGWMAPQAKVDSGEHNFDLFSGPDLYYDSDVDQFTTTRPTRPETSAAATIAGGVQPGPTLFRLQLVGFVGPKERLRGVFENVVTGETIVAGQGRHVEGLDLFIEKMAIGPGDAQGIENSSTRAGVAYAIVRDERGHTSVTLTHGIRQYVGNSSDAEQRAREEPGTAATGSGHNEPVHRPKTPESARLPVTDRSIISAQQPAQRPTADEIEASRPPNA